MKIVNFVITSAAIGIFAGNSTAATLTANSVSLSYTSGGSSINEAFTFLGPDLNVTGGGSTAGGPLTTTTLGTPFSLGLALITSDVGGGGGSGVAAGVTYPSLDFTSGSLLFFGPFVLTSGNLTITVPETISGTVSACSPYVTCINSGGPTAFSIAFNVQGSLTLQAVPISTAPNAYQITSAQFTTAPEPGTMPVLLSGIAGLVLLGIRRRVKTVLKD